MILLICITHDRPPLLPATVAAGIEYVILNADPSGTKLFNNSEWSVRTFTIEPTSEQATPGLSPDNVTVKSVYVNQAALPAANVTLDIGALPVMNYDVKGDKKVDVIDLNAVGQHMN